MIDSKELRVGNWYCLCNPMNRDDMDFSVFDNWTQALDFEAYGLPIPITPDILSKIEGFDKHNSHPNAFDCKTTTQPIRLYVLDGEKECHVHTKPTKEEWYPELCEIKYLHQLQNLYKLLSRKDLIIKL